MNITENYFEDCMHFLLYQELIDGRRNIVGFRSVKPIRTNITTILTIMPGHVKQTEMVDTMFERGVDQTCCPFCKRGVYFDLDLQDLITSA